jgi:hypothetical protein
MQRQKSNNARLRRQDPLWACALRFLDPSSFISFLRKGAMEENRQAFEVLIEMLIDSPKASTKAFSPTSSMTWQSMVGLFLEMRT